jgi:hypothetical protein
VSVGTENDWPQAVTGTSQSASFASNRFRLWRRHRSALSERLIALYAAALTGTVNVSSALI